MANLADSCVLTASRTQAQAPVGACVAPETSLAAVLTLMVTFNATGDVKSVDLLDDDLAHGRF